jgi:hypothetical protein
MKLPLVSLTLLLVVFHFKLFEAKDFDVCEFANKIYKTHEVPRQEI